VGACVERQLHLNPNPLLLAAVPFCVLDSDDLCPQGSWVLVGVTGALEEGQETSLYTVLVED
jgi:hypothetical protein